MIEIIPATDIIGGQCVRLTQGDYASRKTYYRDPLEAALRFEEAGIRRLHMVDLDGAKASEPRNLAVLERIAARIDIPFTVGGGISSVDDASRLLDAGADKITLNSAAVANPALIDAIAARYGSQFVVAAIDARTVDGRWVVTTHGGRRPTQRELFAWAAEAADRGAGEILFTSMDHDGTRGGYPCDTFAQLSLLPVPVIASGGAGSLEHFRDAFVEGKADAVLAASLFHFREIAIPTLKDYLAENGIPVRRN